MKKQKIDIVHLAQLTHLTLSPAEKKLLEKQLKETVASIARLNQLKTEKVTPTLQTGRNKNVFRPDKVEKGLSQKEALENAPQKEGGYFITHEIKWTG